MFVTIPADAILSYNLIGLEVYNTAKEDVRRNQGFGHRKASWRDTEALGIGEHYVAVDPNAISVTYDQSIKWLASANVSKDIGT